MTVTILNGDVRKVLPTLEDNSVDCIVTSPPYWGLRDYGVEGQIGLEPTMQEYLDTMVGVCRELQRVLKPEGSLWLNIGDSYKDKSLCMIPNRLAILLHDSGWYVRSEIIWHKPNPMPESVKDRPTSAHEKVWLLTKSEKYFYDADAVKEKSKGSTGLAADFARVTKEQKIPRNSYTQHRLDRKPTEDNGFRNIRNVWPIPTKPFKGAHFATMPPALAEKCILAGCPVGGMVLDPFGGAGTTGFAANLNGRNATLIELNEEYVEIAEKRIEPNLLEHFEEV